MIFRRFGQVAQLRTLTKRGLASERKLPEHIELILERGQLVNRFQYLLEQRQDAKQLEQKIIDDAAAYQKQAALEVAFLRAQRDQIEQEVILLNRKIDGVESKLSEHYPEHQPIDRFPKPNKYT